MTSDQVASFSVPLHLYIPRGYWHAPEPCGEHSLHVSFAFKSIGASMLMNQKTIGR
ncbi:hypothetical protein GV024_23220 [Salmonella enterica]|uniref:Uncharacterized protein n=1 Tax=Salmonella enterica subsp. enterica serovar Miami TaxID=286780 RepID=A0A753E4I9_SALET|nr:hypothetical protein [Salmonella enterica]ECD0159146.1 hypothetical protein [Salmonella enterica subsp. enterica]ECD4441651.1 hypothetical protein [Salmonella enterica subsp. enterica serovar Florida]ECH9653878.1 hypothetical protein [Salmonella enterica subsp. enterica serovar Miami]ECS7319238.1 hypothetical protein [Salmonella enterica subsp. enterica serovar Miami str. CFSAN000579]ECX3455641.1 hypothetical protein [Salmonella enterica subsp. enterica serovar Rubislaw]EDN5017575.1 hypoth